MPKPSRKRTGRVAFAIGAHPDDIEFGMAGTLLLLGQAGCELHYMTVANGCYGSATMTKQETANVRTQESREAAAVLGAVYHEPIVDDLNVFYAQDLIMKLCAVIRQVNPQILLIPSPQDYMEDHTTACRLAVTAAFCRNIPNYPVDPPVPAIDSHVGLYHAMPVDLTDQLRNPLRPDLFVDVASVLPEVRRALACHRSQKEWLDTTQGMDTYLDWMVEMAAKVGRMSGCFEHAEGWRRHSARGFGPEDFDPLSEALGGLVVHRRTG